MWKIWETKKKGEAENIFLIFVFFFGEKNSPQIENTDLFFR